MGGPGSGPRKGYNTPNNDWRAQHAENMTRVDKMVGRKSVSPQHPSTVSHGSTKSQHDHTMTMGHFGGKSDLRDSMVHKKDKKPEGGPGSG